jgi:flagellar basal body P-ring formation protein FlgA
MKKRGVTPLLLIGVALASSTLAASTTSSSLQAVAEQAVRAQYGQAGSRVVIVPQPLNPRLRLAACPVVLQSHMQARQGIPSRVSVAVSCPGNPGWTIQVPVQMQVFRQVLITSRVLARGDIVGLGDVHSEERDVSRLGYGYVESLDQLAGHSLARPLNAGSVLDPGELNGREAVRAGDQVQLIAQLDGIEVRTSGLALDGGDTGARTRVRNGHSGRIVDGVVMAAGEVKALP